MKLEKIEWHIVSLVAEAKRRICGEAKPSSF